MEAAKKIAKALAWSIVVLAIAIGLSDSAIEGGAQLQKGIAGWLVAIAVIAWITSAISRSRRKRRGEPVSGDTLAKRFSDWLLEHEPLIQLGYRIAIVMLLALGIDKIDRHTWGVANKQLKELDSIESKLSNIEDRASNIEQSLSNVESHASGRTGNWLVVKLAEEVAKGD